MGSDGGCDGFVSVSDEVCWVNKDAVGAVGCNGACVGVAIDGEGNGVTCGEGASGCACNGDVGSAGSAFDAIDDVVRCNHVHSESGSGGAWRCGVDGVGVCRCDGAYVASRAGGRDFGVDGFVAVGHEVGGGDADGVVACSIHSACEVFAIDGESDGVTRAEDARSFASDVGVCWKAFVAVDERYKTTRCWSCATEVMSA
jgi:hypothetical protein